MEELKSFTDSDKLKILAVPANHGGCSYYRIIMPMQKLIQKCPDDVEVVFELNPLQWDEKTKVPILLNTSFNFAGDPLVQTVGQALRTMKKTNIEYLYIPH